MSTEIIRFSEGEDADGPATWGQQYFWDALSRYETAGWYRNVAPVWPVPDDWSLATTLALIGRVVSRYEGLRTDVRDTGAGLRQHLHGQGEFPVEVVETGSESNVEAEVAARLRALPLNMAGRLPFAAAVITQRAKPRWVVLAVSHLAMDASSARLLLSHLSQERQGLPDQPRRRAEAEVSPQGVQLSGRSVARWRAGVTEADMPLRERRSNSDEPVVVQRALSSSVAAQRLETLARSMDAPSSSVLLAAIAIALASLLGRTSLPLQIVTSNRHLALADDYLGVLAQLTALDVGLSPGQTFASVARSLNTKALRAYRSAYWSPVSLEYALRADGRSMDDLLGTTFTVNDVRGGFPGVLPFPLEEDSGEEFATHDLPWWPYQGGRCAIAVAGNKKLLQIAVRADTAYVAPDAVLRMLTSINAVINQAHAGGPETEVSTLSGG